jgi:hypothetical protein
MARIAVAGFGPVKLVLQFALKPILTSLKAKGRPQGAPLLIHDG